MQKKGWIEAVIITPLVALAAFHFASYPEAYARGVGTTSSVELLAAPKKDPRFYSMFVSRVIDGDTIVGVVQWPKLGETLTVRLVGINTPETVHPTKPVERCGPEASNFTKALLPPGTYVWIENDADQNTTDKYGRRVAYVWKGPMLVNAIIITEGWSAAYTRYPFRKSGLFRKLQAEAQTNHRGIWSANDCPPVPPMPSPRALKFGEIPPK